MSGALRVLLPLLLPLILSGFRAPRPAAAQDVVVLEGRGDPELDERLRRLLVPGDFTLVSRDTVIAREDTVSRHLLVVDATLYLEGVVIGDLVGVAANLFVRPPARVRGDAVNAAGGLYRSELAEIAGAIVDRPLAPYRVVREPGLIRIIGTAIVARWELDGLWGFHFPTYDRADALTVRWGASYTGPEVVGFQPRFHGTALLRTGRGAPGGSIEFSLRRPRAALIAAAARETDTREEWIRGRVANTFSFFGATKDYRDYHGVDRVLVRAVRGWRAGGAEVAASVAGHRERAHSLRARNPWTLFGGRPRPNPPIDDGVIAALLVAADGRWASPGVALAAGFDVETAGRAAGGDVSFTGFQAGGTVSLAAPQDRRLHLRWRLQGPIAGTAALPRQRWSFLGGYGTLPTFDIGELRGDRIAFVETRYVTPLPRRRLPILGPPELHLIHAAGRAWSRDPDSPAGPHEDAAGRRTDRVEHNLGFELHSWSPFVGAMTDLRRPLRRITLVLGLVVPIERRFMGARLE